MPKLLDKLENRQALTFDRLKSGALEWVIGDKGSPYYGHVLTSNDLIEEKDVSVREVTPIGKQLMDVSSGGAPECYYMVKENSVRLFKGIEITRMILEAGIHDLDKAFLAGGNRRKRFSGRGRRTETLNLPEEARIRTNKPTPVVAASLGASLPRFD